nr:DUF3784 domain-containing protein [Tissierella sp.]
MNDYQEIILIASLTTFITLLILLFVKKDKAGEWVSWYSKLSRTEKKIYDPSKSLNATKIVLLLTSILTMLGFLASLYIDEKFTPATFGVIIIILIGHFFYSGPKMSLLKDKEDKKS